jgi:diguanylate cyclase (GGDEF)-like protein
MLPDPPSTPKPPRPAAANPTRRGSDRVIRSAAAALNAAGAAGSADAGLPPNPAPLARRALPEPALARMPVRWALPVLLAAAAAAAAGLAVLLAEGFELSAPWSAAVAAALALLAACIPGLAIVGRMAPAAPAHPAQAMALDRQAGAVPRALFLELADREWARARRYGSGAALLLVEVDRYARLCEIHGAAAGEAVLAELARQTAPTLRGADALARFGPSQLAVFLAQADPTGALDVAERIRERAEALNFAHAPADLRLTVSLGVAQLRPAHLNLQALLNDGEDAVLAARQAGGNCVRAAPVDLAQRPMPGTWRSDNHRTKPQ